MSVFNYYQYQDCIYVKGMTMTIWNIYKQSNSSIEIRTVRHVTVTQ